MTEEITKTDINPIVVTGEISMDRIGVDQGMNKIKGEKIFRGNTRSYQNPGRQNSRRYRDNYWNKNYSRDRGRNRSR